MNEVFVIDSKCENRDRTIEAVESVSEARAVQLLQVRVRVRFVRVRVRVRVIFRVRVRVSRARILIAWHIFLECWTTGTAIHSFDDNTSAGLCYASTT